MGIDEVDSIRHLKWGAYLHDIGKIGISDKILLKKGPLTKSEYTFIQQHPELGYRMLQKIPFLKRSAEIVYCHHEKFDGTGYPQKLCGHTIPSLARVFAVADAIDAITSDRPYRKAQDWSNVSWELNQNKGSHFDPAVIEAFHSVPRDEWIQLRDNSDVTILQ
jgi:putative nucleotidyltransferase with HDIG domain